MIDALISGLSQTLQPDVLVYLVFGGLVGLVLGVIPGLGGVVGMSLALPFLFDMPTLPAVALLVAIYATATTGGSVTATLLNVPGTGANAATLLDGYPMTQKGEGTRAVAAGLVSSGIGGVIGVFFLLVAIPLAHPLIMAFSSSEVTMLVLLGITYVGVLGGGSPKRGIISGLLGMLISLIGFDPVTGMDRFIFGIRPLAEGLHIVPVVTGLFAGAQMMKKLAKGEQRQTKGTEVQYEVSAKKFLQGTTDVLKRWWLVIRCSGLGTLIGAIPGLGGDVAAFMAYAHGQQTSKNPELYGKGYVEGVIAPESANNAKEGGSLIPTLFFGVPGSAGMAILLSGFMILGLQPGKEMISTKLDLVFSIGWQLAIANVIGVFMFLPFVKILLRFAYIRDTVMIPAILLTVTTASWIVRGMLVDVFACLIFTLIGYTIRKFNYSAPAVLLGFILGRIFENNLFLSIQLHGPLFLLQKPLALVILVLTILGVAQQVYKNRKHRTAGL